MVGYAQKKVAGDGELSWAHSEVCRTMPCRTTGRRHWEERGPCEQNVFYVLGLAGQRQSVA